MVVAIVALLTTAVVTAFSHDLAKKHDRTELRQEAEATVQAVDQRVQTYIAILKAAAGLLSGPQPVTRPEFRAFVGRLELADRYQGTLGIGYAQRITPDQVEAFNAAVEADYGPGFRVRPEPTDISFPIRFLEPQDERNARALAYDMFSEPRRNEAMVRAMRAGTAQASARVRLMQEYGPNPQAGFLIYVPVYSDDGTVPASLQEREQRIIGFAYAPLRIGDMFSGIFHQHPPRVEYTVFDGREITDRAAELIRSVEQDPSDNLRVVLALDVAGEPWTFVFTPRPEMLATSQTRWTPFIALAGLMIGGFLVTITAMLSGSWARADRAAQDLRRSRDELREVAERFRVALKNAPIFVYNTDAQLRYTWIANPPPGLSAEAILGRRDEEIPGLSETEELRATKRQVLSTGVGMRRTVPLRIAGRLRHFDVTVEPLHREGGALTGLTVAAIDVSERAEASEMLERHARELARSNADLQDFAYIASHDLKEPLRGISNYARFLQEDHAADLGEQGIDKLSTIVRLAQHMYGLLDSLLEYSRVGRTELAVSAVDLGEVLAEVQAALSGRLEQENAQVRVQPGMPTVRADRVRIGQVFANLITNAFKYNLSPVKIIEIGCVRVAGPDGPAPVFFVRDNGIGIEKRHHERIFAMFKRLHPRDQYGGGTGSGLAIVKKIVERHGGHVWLESTLGQGTTFYFTLQPTPPEVVASARAPAAPHSSQPISVRGAVAAGG
jgi:signal transduction histidine kinase